MVLFAYVVRPWASTSQTPSNALSRIECSRSIGTWATDDPVLGWSRISRSICGPPKGPRHRLPRRPLAGSLVHETGVDRDKVVTVLPAPVPATWPRQSRGEFAACQGGRPRYRAGGESGRSLSRAPPCGSRVAGDDRVETANVHARPALVGRVGLRLSAGAHHGIRCDLPGCSSGTTTARRRRGFHRRGRRSAAGRHDWSGESRQRAAALLPGGVAGRARRAMNCC